MPGSQHDAANKLVRDHPELALRLLRTVGGVDLPAGNLLRVHSGELNDRISTDRQADTLILDGPPQDPWYGVISEIETRMSADKTRQALRYAAIVWLRLNTPVHVLFITPDRRAGRFARPVTVHAGALTITLRVCVCGPDQIPPVTDPGDVAADPALAALSVMLHGERKEVDEAFLIGLERLHPDHATRYYEYAFDMAQPSVKNILEALMATTDWPVYSPFAKEHFGKGVASVLVRVLRARGLSVTPDQQARIESTKDLDRLNSWADRAVSVASTDELLDGATSAP